jgi:hypothetical protein
MLFLLLLLIIGLNETGYGVISLLLLLPAAWLFRGELEKIKTP